MADDLTHSETFEDLSVLLKLILYLLQGRKTPIGYANLNHYQIQLGTNVYETVENR